MIILEEKLKTSKPTITGKEVKIDNDEVYRLSKNILFFCYKYKKFLRLKISFNFK